MPGGPRAVRFDIAARVHENAVPALERELRGFGSGGDDAPTAREVPDEGPRCHERVSQRVDRTLDPEVGVEGKHEHHAVGSHVAPGMIPDDQHGTFFGDVGETFDLRGK